MDSHAFTVRLRGEHVRLTRIQFGILRALVWGEGRAIQADELCQQVWGPSSSPRTCVSRVRKHISRLRKRIGDNKRRIIVTVRGVGYRYNLPKWQRLLLVEEQLPGRGGMGASSFGVMPLRRLWLFHLIV